MTTTSIDEETFDLIAFRDLDLPVARKHYFLRVARSLWPFLRIDEEFLDVACTRDKKWKTYEKFDTDTLAAWAIANYLRSPDDSFCLVISKKVSDRIVELVDSCDALRERFAVSRSGGRMKMKWSTRWGLNLVGDPNGFDPRKLIGIQAKYCFVISEHCDHEHMYGALRNLAFNYDFHAILK
jgi:hypothetical protein